MRYQDVSCRAGGGIAVSDNEAHAVILIVEKGRGGGVANTATQGVIFGKLHGMTYHKTWHDGANVVVQEDTCKLIAPDAANLHHVDTIDLKEHCEGLYGITNRRGGYMWSH